MAANNKVIKRKNLTAANTKLLKTKNLIDLGAAKNPAQRAAAKRILKAREMEIIQREKQLVQLFGKKKLNEKRRLGKAARAAAKDEGHLAAMRIAKARAAKEKKRPLTASAIGKNMEANKLRKKNAGVKISNSKGGWIHLDATRNPAVITTSKFKNSKYTLEDYRNISANDKKVKSLMQESKVYARKSGGYATAIKRNAEAGISHIARGRALKSAARGAGVMGMVMLFNKFMNGSDPKKRG